MFMRYLLLVGVVTIAAAGLAACTPSNTPPTAQAVSAGGSGPVAWDYTMRQYNSADHIYLEKQLDSMGALGWECYQMYYTGGGPWFFFKRPLEQ